MILFYKNNCVMRDIDSKRTINAHRKHAAVELRLWSLLEVNMKMRLEVITTCNRCGQMLVVLLLLSDL